MANQEQKNILAKNLKFYINKKGISQTDFAKELNYPEMTVSNWVNAKFYPRIDKIQEMADYFNINKSDLIEDKLSATTLSPDEQSLLDNYNNSNTTGKKIILDTSTNISKAYPYVSRQEMIDYLLSFKRAAYGGAKNPYDMTDEELEEKYYQYKEDFEDD